MLRNAKVVGLFNTAATEAGEVEVEAAEDVEVADGAGGASVVNAVAGELSLSAVTVVAVVDEEPAGRARTKSSMQFQKLKSTSKSAELSSHIIILSL